jgi:hypothetical protein
LTKESPTAEEMWDRLRWFEAQAEEAYSRMYTARPGSELAARYSDAKESLYEAIALANRLGLADESERLSARLEEIKTIFRRQFPG